MSGRIFRVLGSLVILALLMAAVPPHQASAISPDIVISQVYGAGGNVGALYTHDFVELFNRGTTAVSLAGWSVQYASATGTGNFGSSTTQITELPAVSLAPGQYFLIQESSTAAVGSPLPTADIIDATPITMSGSTGKVALANISTSLGCNGGSTLCSAAQLAQIVDLVGYGGANFFEGAAAPLLSNITAAFRANSGCTDTDNNASDFTAATPGPRNTASPLHVCPVTPNLSINDISLSEGNLGTTTFTFTVSLSNPAGVGGVTFDIATADDTATSLDDFLANSLAGQSIPEGDTSYSFNVTVNGETTPEADETFFANVTNVTGATVVDGQGLGTILDDDTPICEKSYMPIYQIQGSGMSAAITGTVTTRGVVVGDYETNTGLRGFYLQDITGDANTATSDGIFVFTGSANTVSAGQVVRVTGYARERFNETTLNGSNSDSSAVPASSIAICGSGSVTPTEVTMPFESLTYPERFEGMLVTLPQQLVISEYYNYDQFGEIVLALPLDGETRPFTPTGVAEPGVDAQARLLANQLRRITLDDASGFSNPFVLRHPNGLPFSLNNTFRGGDIVQNTTGVLGYGFNLYRIQPTAAADYIPVNPRPAAPDPVGGTLRVVGMNTLNYFLTLDGIDERSSDPDNPVDNICGPLISQECRGADLSQPLELQRQRDKLLAALLGLDADVVGLNEIENTADVEPLADIVAGLNAVLGDGTYAYIDTGTIGTDAIRVGLIYKPGRVTPVGAYQILDSSVDPRFDDSKSRPVLAQTFDVNESGARFTVAVNHLKSKGSACAGDPDTGDGQGNCNLTRLAAAQALVDWLASDPTGSGDADYLIIGDLNSYAKEDPIDAIKAGPDDIAGTADDYTNLIAQFQGTYAYSYVFDGMAGYLDHALASPSLTAQVTGASEWHINADESDVLDYDTSFKPASQEALYEPLGYRASDHDPVIVGLDLMKYDFNGFYQPVDNLPAFNKVKAGAAVPVKFSLNGDQGLEIFADGFPTSQRIKCSASEPIDKVEETVVAGASSLEYDPFLDEYTYVWKTKAAWAGTCRQLIVEFVDGSFFLANFRFTK